MGPSISRLVEVARQAVLASPPGHAAQQPLPGTSGERKKTGALSPQAAAGNAGASGRSARRARWGFLEDRREANFEGEFWLFCLGCTSS